MERLAIVARLKEGSEVRAGELLDQGVPFDLAAAGIARHSIYLSTSEVVFVFEGHEVEWILDRLVDEPFHPKLHDALEEWRLIVEGMPRLARERFTWELADGPAATEMLQRKAS